MAQTLVIFMNEKTNEVSPLIWVQKDKSDLDHEYHSEVGDLVEKINGWGVYGKMHVEAQAAEFVGLATTFAKTKPEWFREIRISNMTIFPENIRDATFWKALCNTYPNDMFSIYVVDLANSSWWQYSASGLKRSGR